MARWSPRQAFAEFMRSEWRGMYLALPPLVPTLIWFHNIDLAQLEMTAWVWAWLLFVFACVIIGMEWHWHDHVGHGARKRRAERIARPKQPWDRE
jgi:hypothetical protein